MKDKLKEIGDYNRILLERLMDIQKTNMPRDIKKIISLAIVLGLKTDDGEIIANKLIKNLKWGEMDENKRG